MFRFGRTNWGCTAKMGAEKEVNALTSSKNGYEKIYDLNEPKRAIEFDEVTGHPFPTLHLPKNLEKQITLIEPLKVVSNYNESEGGYWATATLQYVSADASGAYSFYGSVPTNDSQNYAIAGAGSTIWKIEVSIVAEGDIYFTPDTYNIYANLTHYYQVPIQWTDDNNQDHTIYLVYPNECVAVNWSRGYAMQLYRQIEPYSAVYPTSVRWYRNQVTQGNGGAITCVANNLGMWFEAKDFGDFSVQFENRLASPVAISYSKESAFSENNRSKWVFDIVIQPFQSIWLQNNLTTLIECRQAFSVSREGLDGSARSELAPSGTFVINNMPVYSGDFSHYYVWSGVEGATEGIQNAMNLITMGFTAVGSILELKVFGMTFGMLLAIPLIVLIIIAIMRLLAK